MSAAGMGPEFGREWSASLRLGTDAELRGWVEAALGWCGEADAIAMAAFRSAPKTKQKPDGSFVTAADTAIETLIRERVATTFPGNGVVGEEFGNDAAGASVRWIVDPIDGTHNFMRGVPIFATLIAIERDGELQAGIMSAPALGSRWYAWRGGGAWVVEWDGEPRPVAVSRVAELRDASISTSSTVDLEAAGLAPGFMALATSAWRDRGYGDFWSYGLLADGAIDVMVETDLSAWDIAAPAMIVEEAGGRVTDLHGLRAFGGGSYLATNGLLHDTVRSMLLGAKGGGHP